MTRTRTTRVVMTLSSPTGTATPPTTVSCSPGGRRGRLPSCCSGRSSRSVVKETGSDDDDDSEDDRNDVDDDDRAHFDLSLAKEVGLVSVGGAGPTFWSSISPSWSECASWGSPATATLSGWRGRSPCRCRCRCSLCHCRCFDRFVLGVIAPLGCDRPVRSDGRARVSRLVILEQYQAQVRRGKMRSDDIAMIMM